jgi:hypothetical protein
MPGCDVGTRARSRRRWKATASPLNLERGRRSPRTECSSARRCTPKTHTHTHTHLHFVMKLLLLTSKQQPPPAPPRCISVTIHLCITRPDRTSGWRSTGHATCSVPRSALCISGSIIKSSQVKSRTFSAGFHLASAGSFARY